MGTREALFAFNVLAQRSMLVHQPPNASFSDFGKVRHDLLRLLRNDNLDFRGIEITSKLNFNQVASVNVDNKKSDEIEKLRGVKSTHVFLCFLNCSSK